MGSLRFCVFFFFLTAANAIVSIPSGTRWALLAWGDASPADKTDGVGLVDLDIDEQKHMIAGFKKQGMIVMCYFSVGTLEAWRPDVKSNPSLWQSACVHKMAGWDECWLNITNLSLLQTLMTPRFQNAVSRGCDGVELDNIDCFSNDDCFNYLLGGITSAQAKPYQLKFNQWQLDYGHSLGLAIAMKNGLGLMDDQGGQYDMAINEQCAQYQECHKYKAWKSANKLVAHVEYDNRQNYCNYDADLGMMTKYCPGSDSDGDCDNNGPWTDCWSNKDNGSDAYMPKDGSTRKSSKVGQSQQRK